MRGSGLTENKVVKVDTCYQMEPKKWGSGKKENESSGLKEKKIRFSNPINGINKVQKYYN